jgi:hypothetical protein
MHYSSRILSPVLALMIATGSLSVMAQTKTKASSSKSKAAETEEKTPAKKAASRYRRLPTYYGQLELEEAQVESIYEIKDGYGPKIDALLKEIQDLRDKQDEEVKDVLTRTQVTALNKLIAAGSSSKKSASTEKSGEAKSGVAKKSTASKSTTKKATAKE